MGSAIGRHSRRGVVRLVLVLVAATASSRERSVWSRKRELVGLSLG